MKKSEAILYFGSQSKLAKALGLQRASVSKWGDEVPPLRALQLEELTNGALKADRSKIFSANESKSKEEAAP